MPPSMGPSKSRPSAAWRLDPKRTPCQAQSRGCLNGDGPVAHSGCSPQDLTPKTPEPEAQADEVDTQLVRHPRYLLTLKGRPPFRLAGMETYERLHDVAGFALDLLSTHYDPRLSQLGQGLRSALSPLAQLYHEVQQGAAWRRDIAYILEPAAPPRSADLVASQLRRYLDTVCDRPDLPATLTTFGAHLDKVSRSYWPGLFHC